MWGLLNTLLHKGQCNLAEASSANNVISWSEENKYNYSVAFLSSQEICIGHRTRHSLMLTSRNLFIYIISINVMLRGGKVTHTPSHHSISRWSSLLVSSRYVNALPTHYSVRPVCQFTRRHATRCWSISNRSTHPIIHSSPDTVSVY